MELVVLGAAEEDSMVEVARVVSGRVEVSVVVEEPYVWVTVMVEQSVMVFVRVTFLAVARERVLRRTVKVRARIVDDVRRVGEVSVWTSTEAGVFALCLFAVESFPSE